MKSIKTGPLKSLIPFSFQREPLTNGGTPREDLAPQDHGVSD